VTYDKITAIFHLAYDWKIALNAIRRLAPHVDKVLLVFDQDCKTWTLRDYEKPDFGVVYAHLAYHGVKYNHIDILQQPFSSALYTDPAMLRYSRLPHILGLKPPSLYRETLQRNWSTLQAEPESWIMQIDGDEWMERPSAFCQWLRQQDTESVIYARWLNVWKRVKGGFLIVDPDTLADGSFARLATTRPGDLSVSRAPARGDVVWAPQRLLHWTLGGRGGRVALEQKLKGWGYMPSDEAADAFLDVWDQTNETNYQDQRWVNPTRAPGYSNERLMFITQEELNRRYGPDDYERFSEEWPPTTT